MTFHLLLLEAKKGKGEKEKELCVVTVLHICGALILLSAI